MKKVGTLQKGRVVQVKPKVLWIGDAVAHTGFARVTHDVLHRLRKWYDVSVLGINYRGDPHPYPYPIYPPQTDLYGYHRVRSLIQTIQPDIICILNDPWIIATYLDAIGSSRIPVVAYTPIDGLHPSPTYCEKLNKLSALCTYTEFGKDQLRQSGVTIPMYVIPHGVDTSMYVPVPKTQARAMLNLDPSWYIVGVVDRNQPRKRIDRAFHCFATWAREKPSHVKLYYHGAVIDVGWDIIDLARFYAIEDRLILTSTTISAYEGLPEDKMKYVYSSMDVKLSTTLGEGWGLTTMESMACRVPQIVPEWSALAEWCRGAVHYVPCTDTYVHTGGINTVGGVCDIQATVDALELMYKDTVYRERMADAAYALVKQPKFRWDSIAEQFHAVFSSVLSISPFQKD